MWEPLAPPARCEEIDTARAAASVLHACESAYAAFLYPERRRRLLRSRDAEVSLPFSPRPSHRGGGAATYVRRVEEAVTIS